uniref:Hexosyltransferase n=1 Tax=Bursaphelenchus xylophilus TaxID=6326 RepID=A0A1I7SJJ1_BURXY
MGRSGQAGPGLFQICSGPAQPDCHLYFYVSEAEYPDKKYPHVCSGPAYLMTNEAVWKILKTIPSLKFFKFEDILISGTARQKSNIQLISSMIVDGNSATH